MSSHENRQFFSIVPVYKYPHAVLYLQCTGNSYNYLQIYQSQETPAPHVADCHQTWIAAFQSKPPKLVVSSPHTQVEEIQKTSLEVSEIGPIHDF